MGLKCDKKHAFGPRKRPGNSLHSKCARNGTSNSGRNPRARHRPLAHQHAPSRALHGLEWHDHAKTAAASSGALIHARA